MPVRRPIWYGVHFTRLVDKGVKTGVTDVVTRQVVFLARVAEPNQQNRLIQPDRYVIDGVTGLRALLEPRHVPQYY